MQTENKTIEIRDILIVPPMNLSYGEFKKPLVYPISNLNKYALNVNHNSFGTGRLPIENYSFQQEVEDRKEPRDQRIVTHITYLANKADQIHKENNFDLVSGKIAEGNENKITRLSFIEFAFYTKETPLSLAEFIKIKQALYTLSSQLSPNLHLVLSSFPVLINHSKKMADFRNETLYIQCGPSPEIRSFYKLIHSPEDIFYDIEPEAPDESMLIEEKGGVFQFTTYGNETGWIVLEVCLEHLKGLGLNKLIQEYQDAEEFHEAVPPLKVSHIITSNRITFFPEHHVGAKYTHNTPSFEDRGQRSALTPSRGNSFFKRTFLNEDLTFGPSMVAMEISDSTPLPDLRKEIING